MSFARMTARTAGRVPALTLRTTSPRARTFRRRPERRRNPCAPRPQFREGTRWERAVQFVGAHGPRRACGFTLPRRSLALGTVPAVLRPRLAPRMGGCKPLALLRHGCDEVVLGHDARP